MDLLDDKRGNTTMFKHRNEATQIANIVQPQNNRHYCEPNPHFFPFHLAFCKLSQHNTTIMKVIFSIVQK